MSSDPNYGKIFYKGQEMEFIPGEVEVDIDDWDLARNLARPTITIKGDLLSSDYIKKEKTQMNTTTRKKIFLMDKDERFLYEKGLIDIDGELTEEGRVEFAQFLFDSDTDIRTDFAHFLWTLEHPELQDEENEDGE